jgi:hypothetical protein
LCLSFSQNLEWFFFQYSLVFFLGQLKIALPSNILSKYEDRVQEENINLADLADLVN